MENGEMKDRIAHIIRAKNLTAGEFAARLGIQPSNVSHLLSGRNNPSLDFVKKLKETFPEYNLDWIIMGVGPMTVSEPFMYSAPPTTLFETDPVEDAPAEMPSSAESVEVESRQEPTASKPLTTPEGIIMVFDDGTYKFLSPR